jgi:hypothetical protein
MHRCFLVGALVALGLLLVACQSTTASIQGKEDMLAAAGFTLQPANTPQRLAALKSLPPHKFVQQTANNKVVYVYGDPSICKCVYFGNQQAYGTYRAMVFQQKIADEQQMTAAMQQQAAFDFGPWGPGIWY